MTFTREDERQLTALIERKAAWEQERASKLRDAVTELWGEAGSNCRDQIYSLLADNAAMLVDALRQFVPDSYQDSDRFCFAIVCTREPTPVRYFKALPEVCASLGDEIEVHRLMIQRWRPGCHSTLADGRIVFCFKE